MAVFTCVGTMYQNDIHESTLYLRIERCGVVRAAFSWASLNIRLKGKGKIVPVHAMKAYRGGAIAPVILNLGTI